MRKMETEMRKMHVTRWVRIAAAVALSGAGLLLGCTTGTPAAPEGSEMQLDCDVVASDPPAGNFTSIIVASVRDAVSDVPAVGVGVFFRVASGPASLQGQNPVVTDDDGLARIIVVGTAAFGNDSVDIEASSGEVEADISIGVAGCTGGGGAQEPVARMTVTPPTPDIGEEVEVNVSSSTDADCAGMEPDDWEVDWGDGTTRSTGSFDSATIARHTYSGMARTVTIVVTVTDCNGLTDDVEQQVPLS